MKRFRRAALSGVVALGMLTMVPGAVFAAQPSCGDTLMANTTLTADLDCSGYGGTALYFGKKGLTLNLNGHTIFGPVGADSYSGVDTNYKKHVTIKNGRIENFETAIYLDYSVGGTFKNLTLVGDPADASNSTGVYVYYGTTNIINNLTIRGFYYGFYAYGSAENWFTNNDVSDATYGAYSEYDSGDQIIGNTFWNYSYAGWYDDYSAHQVYKNNSADGSMGNANYGFYLDCDDYGWAQVINNTATNNSDYGFYFYYCYDDNNYTVGSLFSGNVANDNGPNSDGIGFYDYYSINSTWMNNTAKRNGDEGFYLDYPGLVVFKWNVAKKNGGDGIYVTDNYGSGYANFKTFASNTSNWNGGYGITADYGITGASGNVAHNNGTAPDDCWNVDCN